MLFPQARLWPTKKDLVRDLMISGLMGSLCADGCQRAQQLHVTTTWIIHWKIWKFVQRNPPANTEVLPHRTVHKLCDMHYSAANRRHILTPKHPVSLFCFSSGVETSYSSLCVFMYSVLSCVIVIWDLHWLKYSYQHSYSCTNTSNKKYSSSLSCII